MAHTALWEKAPQILCGQCEFCNSSSLYYTSIKIFRRCGETACQDIRYDEAEINHPNGASSLDWVLQVIGYRQGKLIEGPSSP